MHDICIPFYAHFLLRKKEQKHKIIFDTVIKNRNFKKNIDNRYYIVYNKNKM